MKNYNWKEITSYEKAVEVCEVSEKNKIFDCDPEYVVSLKKLRHIIHVINQDWKPNYKDNNQKKFYPYFDLSSSFQFDTTNYCYFSANADESIRLCLETQEKAEYMGMTFTKLYENFLLD
jgi:hypothetical protein